MEPEIYTSTKKLFYYNFLPTKAEEYYRIKKFDRILVEIRDYYEPPELYEKTTRLLNQSEISSEKFRISRSDLFEKVLRYWTMKDTYDLVSGARVKVTLLDVTVDENPIKYETNIDLCMTADEDCELSCSEFMKARELKAGDEIVFYWDSDENRFAIKTFHKVGEAICVPDEDISP